MISSSSPRSNLSPRDLQIVSTVTRFKQATATQLRRLHFSDGSPLSQGPRQRRALARLVRWGQLARLPRPVGGYAGGSEGFVYIPAGSKARTCNPHTLDITELFVQLSEVCIKAAPEYTEVGATIKPLLIAFDPEPYCHVQVGHLELKPDAYLRIRTDLTRRYFIEVDLGTEFRPQLNTKMRRYCGAYKKWAYRSDISEFDSKTFPLVLFIVPDEVRRRFVESVVKRQDEPQLFQICLFKDAIQTLGG